MVIKGSSRYEWKKALIEESDKLMQRDPVLTPHVSSQEQLEDELSKVRSSRVIMRGKFDHTKGMVDPSTIHRIGLTTVVHVERRIAIGATLCTSKL